MTVCEYADAGQPSDFNLDVSSQNLTIYKSIEEFNEKEGGVSLTEPEEKLFGTHLKELKETMKDLLR